MRIHLKTNPINEKVPFNYQPKLTGTLHKWLGNNMLHDSLSLYSFSWLKNSRQGSGGLNFPNGAEWFFSSYDDSILKHLVKGIQSDPTINFGLTIKEIMIKEYPTFSNAVAFSVASPVFIKRRLNESIKHFTYSDENGQKRIVFNGPVNGFQGITRFVMGLCDDVQIIAPKSFKAEIDGKLKQANHLNKKK